LRLRFQFRNALKMGRMQDPARAARARNKKKKALISGTIGLKLDVRAFVVSLPCPAHNMHVADHNGDAETFWTGGVEWVSAPSRVARTPP
jgi:hypothetical protein